MVQGAGNLQDRWMIDIQASSQGVRQVNHNSSGAVSETVSQGVFQVEQ
jgi:hypothetical protein